MVLLQKADSDLETAAAGSTWWLRGCCRESGEAQADARPMPSEQLLPLHSHIKIGKPSQPNWEIRQSWSGSGPKWVQESDAKKKKKNKRRSGDEGEMGDVDTIHTLLTYCISFLHLSHTEKCCSFHCRATNSIRCMCYSVIVSLIVYFLRRMSLFSKQNIHVFFDFGTWVEIKVIYCVVD